MSSRRRLCVTLALVVPLFALRAGAAGPADPELLQRAEAAIGGRRYDEALAAFAEADRIAGGGCPECLLGQARVYELQGKGRKAADLARQALRLDAPAEGKVQAFRDYLGREPQVSGAKATRIAFCRYLREQGIAYSPPEPSPAGSEATPGSQEARKGGGVSRPQIIHRTAPAVPEMVRTVRGTVILEAVIDESGCVGQVRVLSGLDRHLDEAAVDTVRQWVFLPAKFQGKGVPVYYSMTVNFAGQ